jgi:hypothetical protein
VIVSQKTEVVCDRCGKDISNPNDYYVPTYALKDYSAKITLWGVGEPRYSQGQRIDLCPECYEKFVNFLEGGAE